MAPGIHPLPASCRAGDVVKAGEFLWFVNKAGERLDGKT
jgi:hypothetical protein